MDKIIVFAGTTEGRKIVEALRGERVVVVVCVATDYGKELLLPGGNVRVSSRRLNLEEMERFLEKEKPDMVLDATHPFAKEVTSNLQNVCKKRSVTYKRVLRDGNSPIEGAIYMNTVEEAVEYLEYTNGHILIATGSKELKAYTRLSDYENRCYVRVLSTKEAILESVESGFVGAHLIAMQGPFSMELNQALLEQTKAEYFVTKESGMTGGFPEKVEAARALNCTLIVIGRPLEEEGESVTEVIKKLRITYKIEKQPKITLVGIGPGSVEQMSIKAKEEIESADLVIGANRMLAFPKEKQKKTYESYLPAEILKCVEDNQELDHIVIVLSGDISFYSGAKKILDILKGRKVECLPGISSVSYFASKIKESLDDAALVSCHGKAENIIGLLRSHKKVCILMDGKESIDLLCRELIYYGYEDIIMYIGNQLSYKEERIIMTTPKEGPKEEIQGLSVVYLRQKKEKVSIVTHGMLDEEFIRGEVPMTKSEVRSISISKLGLTSKSIVYDIGSGTGSVAIEMAKQVMEGHVYAFEKNSEGITLIEANKKKHKTSNLTIIKGSAPDILKKCKVPTHGFIGGSSGELIEIVKALQIKNPNIKIVMNAITLETVSEILNFAKKERFQIDVVQVSISKGKKIGEYTMMQGENPIYIITFGGDYE